MRVLMAALAISIAAVPALALAQAPVAAHYTADQTDLGTLLDDPATKAVLMKHIPDLISSDQIQMARSMSLKTLQGYAGDKLTDDKITAINADLAKLPAKK